MCTGSLLCMPLRVLQQRRAQRVVPVLVAGAVHVVDEPLRAVGVGQAALLDDPEQPVDLRRRGAPGLQPLVGQRQQPAQHQLGGPDLADARPVDLGVDPLPGGDVEVLLGGAERHLRPHAAARSRPARAPARSRTRRSRPCRRPSDRRRAAGSRPAGAGRRSRRRRWAGSSGRSCRCAAAARRAWECRRSRGSRAGPRRR